MEWLFFDGIDMNCREKPVVRMDDVILNACARAACAEFSGFDETVSWADGASCAHGQLRLLGIWKNALIRLESALWQSKVPRWWMQSRNYANNLWNPFLKRSNSSLPQSN